MAQTRLQIYEKKNPPKLTFQEQLDMMKKQAISLGFPIPKPNGTL